MAYKVEIRCGNCKVWTDILEKPIACITCHEYTGFIPSEAAKMRLEMLALTEKLESERGAK